MRREAALRITTAAILTTAQGVGCGGDNTTGRRPDAATDGAVDVSGDATTTGCAVGTGPRCLYRSPRAFQDIREVVGMNLEGAIGGRTLPVLIRYPADAREPLPVVVWAHAGGWSATGHRSGDAWSASLARAGYAVVHVAHVPPTRAQLDAICVTVGITRRAECEDLSLTGDHDGDGTATRNTFEAIGVGRAADTRLVLDRLGGIADRFTTQTSVRLDTARVTVAGWSGGSQNPMGLAGAARDLSATLSRYTNPDPRPVAFIAISPQGPGYSGFFATAMGSSWDAVRGPTLVMTGDGDEKPANTLTGPIRRRAFELMPTGQKYLFYSRVQNPDIAHGDFNLGGAMSGDARRVALAESLVSVALAFLDAHVRGEAGALRWLAADDARAGVSGDADWVRR